MTHTHFRWMLLVLLAWAFTACNDDNDKANPALYQKGAFVLNEGAFGQGNASVDFISMPGDSIQHEIFTENLQRPLGDVLQSALLHDGTLYLALNGSGKVEAVPHKEFSESRTLQGLASPRYLAAASGKLYISMWGEGGAIRVADVQTLDTLTTLPAGTGPEGLLTANNELWVANGGGLGVDSTIMVFNASDVRVQTIEVGYNPKELVQDANGDIWVNCFGYTQYDANFNVVAEYGGSLVQLDATTYQLKNQWPLPDKGHAQHLDISPDGQTIYYGGGFGFSGIYAMDITAGSLPLEPLINGFFYGFNVNPETGNVWATTAPSFTEPGTVISYTTEGSKQAEYVAGLGPNGLVFQ